MTNKCKQKHSYLAAVIVTNPIRARTDDRKDCFPFGMSDKSSSIMSCIYMTETSNQNGLQEANEFVKRF